MTLAWQTFIERIHGTSNVDALSDAMAEMAGTLGVVGFAYVSSLTFGPRPPPYITTYPGQWVRRYLDRRYYEIDPVFKRAQSSAIPFAWDRGAPDVRVSSEQQRLFAEAREFGIAGGYTVPIPDGTGDVATLSFATGQENELPVEDRGLLHLAAVYFHLHVRHQLKPAAEIDCHLLSPEEAACLQRTARGENTGTISGLLDLPRRRVVSHLKNARLKLKAATLPQAVALALRSRLIKL